MTSTTTSSTTEAALEAAIQAMTDTSSSSKIFDVTIICTTDDHQAAYWTKRLSEGICRSSSSSSSSSSSTASPDTKKVKSEFPIALAVSEDWGSGGAGNGLGTLYAYEKACRIAKERHDGLDLHQLLLDQKISAAIYHTAGKGTRLAPLPASENNNKPGVKLPVCHELSDGTLEPLTVLEAVVKQTGVYAASRLGRLSVYWGDQVFVPSAPFVYAPTHHVDIMCTLLGDAAPSAAEWAAQGLDKYGVIAVGTDGQAAQVEKVDHATATRMLQSLGMEIAQVGPSLGSFSVSAVVLRALCAEYANELKEKTAKFDTDPHFWMPLTLTSKDYVSLMAQKGVEEEVSKAHHERMTKMKDNLDLGDLGLFGAVDVGKDACWWDYGQLKYYYDYNIKLLDTDDNAKFLRKFLGVTSKQMNSHLGEKVVVDDVSCVFGTTIQEQGAVTKSVLASVYARDVQAQDAIVINCTAPRIRAGRGSICYNLVDDDEIVVPDGGVHVGVTNEEGQFTLIKSRRDVCGGQAWKQVLEGNDLSFEAVHAKNKDSDVAAIEIKRKEMHDKVQKSW